MKKPVFFTKPRAGKISLWVEMQGHNPHNIWDLPAEFVTDEVLRAIASAFSRGVSFAVAEMNSVRIDTSLCKNWERREGDE